MPEICFLHVYAVGALIELVYYRGNRSNCLGCYLTVDVHVHRQTRAI